MDSTPILRTVVVTGANKGIGYHIIQKLYNGPTPYDIILTSRNETLGLEALDTITKKSKPTQSKIQYQQLDVSNTKSIKQFLEWFKQEKGRLDVLINNAGIGYVAHNLNEHLSTLKINFLGAYNLTEAALPLLAKDGKVMMISSGLGDLSSQGKEGKKLFTDPSLDRESILALYNKIYASTEKGNQAKDGFNSQSYGNSKTLMNAYVRYVLPKYLTDDQQCFTVCPGWCQTDMGGGGAPRSADQGADTPVYLVNLPFKRDPKLHGKYFRDRKVVSF